MFTVGVHLDQRNAEMVITVAGKEASKQETVDFITSVWRLLKELSDLNRPLTSPTPGSKKAIVLTVG